VLRVSVPNGPKRALLTVRIEHRRARRVAVRLRTRPLHVCGSAWATTVAAAGGARLVIDPEPDFGVVSHVIACVAGKRAEELTTKESDPVFGHFGPAAISRDVAAITISGGYRGEDVASIILLDLHTTTVSWVPAFNEDDLGPQYAFDRLLLTKRNAFVLAEEVDHRVRIRVIGAGADRILDAGPGVDPDSLEVRGNTVWWTRAGVQHTAKL
jgi:hypothetical protein